MEAWHNSVRTAIAAAGATEPQPAGSGGDECVARTADRGSVDGWRALCYPGEGVEGGAEA